VSLQNLQQAFSDARYSSGVRGARKVTSASFLITATGVRSSCAASAVNCCMSANRFFQPSNHVVECRRQSAKFVVRIGNANRRLSRLTEISWATRVMRSIGAKARRASKYPPRLLPLGTTGRAPGDFLRVRSVHVHRRPKSRPTRAVNGPSGPEIRRLAIRHRLPSDALISRIGRACRRLLRFCAWKRFTAQTAAEKRCGTVRVTNVKEYILVVGQTVDAIEHLRPPWC